MPVPVYNEQEPDEVVIGVMGATGAGKSTFINLVSGSNLGVGMGLKSCTSKVETGSTFELFGRLITLVDTPGFDDTMMSDTDILKMIGVYLSSTYKAGKKLSGLIYMHRISDFRMTGVSRRNFKMFRQLCGDETLKNVVIVTTMWSEVTRERGEAREHELRTDDVLFKPVLDKNALMMRHDASLASAQAIIRQIVDNHPLPLRFQREIVDEHKDVTETGAGIELDRELAALREAHKKQLADIQREMEEAIAEKDLETKKELDEVKAKLQSDMTRIESERDSFSRAFQEEKARADARVQEIQQALQQEIQTREQRQKDLDKLTNDLQQSREEFARERQNMQAQLREASKRRRSGLFGAIGHAIDSLF